MDSAVAAWKTSPHPTPTAILGYCGGVWYAVSSDTDTVVQFVKSTTNGHGKVFAVVKSKCVLQQQGQYYVYVVTEPGALSVISCTQPDKKDGKESVEHWVVKTILPFFKTSI